MKNSGPHWPRLLKAAGKVPHVKTDFNKWVDEDEEDEMERGACVGKGAGTPPPHSRCLAPVCRPTKKKEKYTKLEDDAFAHHIVQLACALSQRR